MDLVELKIFKTVAEQGGITKAATALHRVQSNVTTRVKQLEERLGTKLFHRQGRKLVLSSEGKVLLAYADRLLRLSSEAQAALKGHGPHGLFKLGTLESTAATRLPPVLARYHRGYPAVRLELVTGPSGSWNTAPTMRSPRAWPQAAASRWCRSRCCARSASRRRSRCIHCRQASPTRRPCWSGAAATAPRRSTPCAKNCVEDLRRRLHLRAARGQADNRGLCGAGQKCSQA